MGGVVNVDDYDAVLYDKSGGSWSRVSVLTTFGAEWQSSKRDNRFMTITDGGSGDTRIATISHQNILNTTLQFNTGAEVTNADA